jgi:predicted acyl esterase
MVDGKVELTGGLDMFDLRAMTDYGYVVAIADIRGKGASFGSRRGFVSSQEGGDGYEINEWLARQPWSSGKTGLTGCSYVGGSVDNVAGTAPPSLKAIFPGSTVYDRYNFASRGGLMAQYHTRPEDPNEDTGAGTLPVDADKDGRMLEAARLEHRKNTAMVDTWRDIPFRDSWSPTLQSRFWEESSPSSRRNVTERSGVAMYRWAGWQDEFSSEQFLAYNNYRNPRKVLLLGGEHCVLDGFDMFAEHLRFFDYWLKGVDNGIMSEPAITYRTWNAPKGSEWRTTDVWPLPGTAQLRLYLGFSGLTDASSKASGGQAFTVDYSVLKNDGSTPSWIPSQDGHGASFGTAPFDKDAEITGHPVVHLWISSTASDGVIFAYLDEVRPDGTAIVRSHGRLRASHRALGTAPFANLGLPFHRSFAEDVSPLTLGKPVELVFDMLPTSTIVQKGSRLRLVVTGADPRQRLSPPQSLPPRVTVHYGGAFASYIDLPVIPAQHAKAVK